VGDPVSDVLRVYFDDDEINALDGYPWKWELGVQRPLMSPEGKWILVLQPGESLQRIPDYVREQAGHRCVRCHHPFVVGETSGQWSPCHEQCRHTSPIRWSDDDGAHWQQEDSQMLPVAEARKVIVYALNQGWRIEAQWRVLTVHHLNGVKHDCRWWNLVALCQRCHLVIQSKVHLERPWNREHSDWFKPYVAGYYAAAILGEELGREEVEARMEEILSLERTQERLPGVL
jgi:5-methylcytosine-specific restriction endonuclease McrA